MENSIKKIYQYVDESKDEMIALWKEIVNLESYAREKEKVDILAQRLKEEFEKEKLICKLVEVGEENGVTLVGELGSDRENKPVIFS